MVETWAELLDRIEASIADAECGAGARPVDLSVADVLGALPSELQNRATDLAARALSLEVQLSARFAAVEAELGRHGPRPKPAVPPAPTHLDHLA